MFLFVHFISCHFISFFDLSLLDPDYLAFLESLNKDEEPPPSIEAHLEEIEAKKCKNFHIFICVIFKKVLRD